MFKNNVTGKVQQYFAIVIIVMLAVGILYFLGSKFVGLFSKPDPIYLENIEKSFTTENTVMDYSTFYTLDGVLEQWLNSVLENKYDEVYDIMIPEYKKLYSSSETEKILTDYCNNKLSDMSGDVNYITEYSLKVAYNIDDLYILKFLDIKGNDMYIAVKYGKGNTYNFTFVEKNNANEGE